MVGCCDGGEKMADRAQRAKTGGDEYSTSLLGVGGANGKQGKGVERGSQDRYSGRNSVVESRGLSAKGGAVATQLGREVVFGCVGANRKAKGSVGLAVASGGTPNCQGGSVAFRNC